MAKSEELLSIWNKACKHYHVPEQVAYTWYERIRNKLNESGDNRIYHNWSDMFVPKSEDLAKCKPHIVLATFFQYYEFDLAKSCVNVNKNCQVFREFCQEALIEDEQVKENVCYLLGEKRTELMSDDIEEDAAVLQDLDLVILAAPPELYKRYAELSRREWCALGESNYNHLRKKTLSTLLALDIYKTAQYNEKYAIAARKNIESELKDLN